MTETPEQRSRIMRAVRSRDTFPELSLRRLLRSLGRTGYRLHRKDLPAHTRQRDSKCLAELAGMGWDVLTVWECELRDLNKLTTSLRSFLERAT